MRFAYQNGGEGLNEAPDSVMFSHIKQLGPLLEKNKDVIHVVQMGFLGAWAEWHSYKMEHDRVRLIREVANMTPKGIYLQIRIPEYKNLIPKADPIFSRLGYHNDSLFGTVTGSQAGLGTGNVDVGKPDWDQVTPGGGVHPDRRGTVLGQMVDQPGRQQRRLSARRLQGHRAAQSAPVHVAEHQPQLSRGRV